MEVDTKPMHERLSEAAAQCRERAAIETDMWFAFDMLDVASALDRCAVTLNPETKP